MRRREFVSLFGGAAVAWPLAARGQQPVRRDRGLADNGSIIGREVTIDYQWVHGRFDRLPAMAAELIRRQVALIVTLGPPAGLAAKAVTMRMPIASLA